MTTRTSQGSGTGDGDGADERFARAVQSGLRGVGDPSLDADLDLVAALRQAGAGLGPTADERARMRSAVMARFLSEVPERPVDRLDEPVHLGARAAAADASPVDGAGPDGPDRGADVVALPVQRTRPSPRTGTVVSEARSRLVVVAAAALCLFVSLSGMSLLLSRDAVPGDALYGIKRVAEAAELGLTFGEQDRALKQLEFATNRVFEIEVLAEQAEEAGGSGEAQEQLIRALDDFDTGTVDGARLLTEVAAAQGSPALLATLSQWGQTQEGRLEQVQAALPLEVTVRMGSTLDLLAQVVDRADRLEERSGCASTGSDDLGAVPDETCTAVAVPAPGPAAPPADQPPAQAGGPALPAPPAGPVAPAPPQVTTSRSVPAPGGGPGRPGSVATTEAPVPVPPVAEPADPAPDPDPGPAPDPAPDPTQPETTTPAPPALVPSVPSAPAPPAAGQVRLPALPEIALG